MSYIAVVVIVALLTTVLVAACKGFWGTPSEGAITRAGRRGEEYAVDMIRRVMREDDRLFTNVCIEPDGRKTELDIIIVNKYGVFIIEVKNYRGLLSGGADDFKWQKLKTTDAGNTYEKTVRNPIRQVKRQIFLLSRFLDANGIKAWISGYAYIIYANAPVKSEYLLESLDDIDRAIHTRDRRLLDDETIERIAGLMALLSA